ncbi:hypothetical protein OHC33_009609 [Knufia fluminis]|uniref:Uncharacterized protein n=1 Tax=Knufia fluminis TaxID=191047 RepID=A0AAN8EAP8_9EURO|nr:hypothetical protein OHC33_009609 [Knufia fluminis]
MSFYEPQGWQAPVRQASWEQPPPPSRSGASSTSQREEPNAFATQFEEIDRAVDNLVKSGKLYAGGPRREPPPAMYSPHGGPRAHHGRQSVGDFRHSHRSPAGQQNFYAAQRYQGRPSEADQMLQAKRRMAAQRERELRNYHQEQQYNRSVLAEMASNKSDRSMSPSTLSEEGRRELIARQRQALYGPDGAGFVPHGQYNQEGAQNEQQSGPGGMRGPSPRGMDPFGMSGQGENIQQQTGENQNTSPPSHQQGKAPTPPTGDDSVHSRTISKSTTAPISGSMGPIGSRPNPPHMPGQMNKRTTSPLPSSLAFGFGNNEAGNDRAASGNSGAGQKENQAPSMGTWGTGSGVWGNKIGSSVWS